MKTVVLIPVVAGMFVLHSAVAILAAPPEEGAPLFVVARPGADIDWILATADGYRIGPADPVIGAVVHSDRPAFAARLRDAGAILVVAHSSIAGIGCQAT
ncbi:hypothetical protein [Jannaschia sp. 2305UL9-9]|uniref:hypothetical protein n=1 Tax=Jannaschia sp. 2305UL9-9 TaxID=3121638 RepID=UPI003529CF79